MTAKGKGRGGEGRGGEGRGGEGRGGEGRGGEGRGGEGRGGEGRGGEDNSLLTVTLAVLMYWKSVTTSGMVKLTAHEYMPAWETVSW